jgi:uncharacterized protein (DUF2345 family)
MHVAQTGTSGGFFFSTLKAVSGSITCGQFLDTFGLQLAASQDTLQLAATQDRLQLAASQDTLQLTASQDTLQLAASQDTLQLAVSQDTLQLAVSQDRLQLAASQDRLQLAASQDMLQLAASQDTLQLVASQDTLQLVASQDRLHNKTLLLLFHEINAIWKDVPNNCRTFLHDIYPMFMYGIGTGPSHINSVTVFEISDKIQLRRHPKWRTCVHFTRQLLV